MGSTVVINGKGWSVKIMAPFRNHSEINYYYLADLLYVSGDKENARWYNELLNKLVVNRITPGLAIAKR